MTVWAWLILGGAAWVTFALGLELVGRGRRIAELERTLSGVQSDRDASAAYAANAEREREHAQAALGALMLRTGFETLEVTQEWLRRTPQRVVVWFDFQRQVLRAGRRSA